MRGNIFLVGVSHLNRYCPNCGASVYDTARFCNQCGAQLMPTQAAEIPIRPPATSPFGSEAPPPIPVRSAPPPPPAELAPNIAGLLCYPLSIVSGLIFLALRPYSQHQFVRFHAYQSVYFFFTLLVLNFVLGILSILLPATIENLMASGLRLVAIGGTGWAMYQAWLGVMFKFPMIGDLAETQSMKP